MRDTSYVLRTKNSRGTYKRMSTREGVHRKLGVIKVGRDKEKRNSAEKYQACGQKKCNLESHNVLENVRAAKRAS